MMSLQFWFGGLLENIENFFVMILNVYVFLLVDVKLKYDDFVVFLDIGIWYFMVFQMYDDIKEYLNWYGIRCDVNEVFKDFKVLVVGIVLQWSYIVMGDEGYYVVVIMEMEVRGVKVVFIFVGEFFD